MHRRFAPAAAPTMTVAAMTIAVMTIAAPPRADAQEPPQFRFNREAQLSCPDDQVVWLNAGNGGFYRRGQNGYASTMTGPGAFVCRRQAEKAGHKPGRDFGEQDSGQQNFRMIEPPPKPAAPAP